MRCFKPIPGIAVLAAVLLVLGCRVGNCATEHAKNSYAVVVSEGTYTNEAWKAVADALVEKHGASLIRYQDSFAEALPQLKQLVPKYTCFVVRPEETGRNHVIRINRFTRKYDDDPYGDTIWGIITGYEPEDALRMARATEPRIVSTALLTAGMGSERWKEAYYISDGVRGEYGHKRPDGKAIKHNEGLRDQTQRWAEYWKRLDPDAVVSSSHAGSAVLTIPFGQGKLICRNGKLFGMVGNRPSSIPEGLEDRKLKPGTLIPISDPVKPKLYFPVGNCQIGEITARNCMALAWMGHGKANQMIAYVVPTWVGEGGWGTLKYWESLAGVAPLNEAFYFNNMSIVNRIANGNAKLTRLDFPLKHDQKFGDTLNEALKDVPGGGHFRRLMYDRDTLAFYGDPALEIRLDPEHTIKHLHTIGLREADGIWTATIRARVDHQKAGPIGAFFPHRLGNFNLISGQKYKPLLLDNCILVTAPGPLKKGEQYQVVFKAEPLHRAGGEGD